MGSSPLSKEGEVASKQASDWGRKEDKIRQGGE